MNLLGEVLKTDMALTSVSRAPGAFATSGIYPMNEQRKALAVVHLVSANMQAGDAIDIGIVDDMIAAPAASGALAALDAAASPSLIVFDHITAGVHVQALSIEFAAAADGAVVVNGVTFPYDAAPATAFEWTTAAQFAAAVTAAGLGLTAVAVGTVVTIRSTIPGDRDITVTETVTAIVAADVLTLEAVAYMEVDADELVNGSTGIRVVADNLAANTGTAILGAVLLRGDPRYAPVTQRVAAP